MSEKGNDHELSTGNVFADLGLPQADELLAKAALARQISTIATRRRMSQAQAARLLRTTQPKVSDLFAGKLAGFSMERLIRFLNALGHDVNITVSASSTTSPPATVRVAQSGGRRKPRGARRGTAA